MDPILIGPVVFIILALVVLPRLMGRERKKAVAVFQALGERPGHSFRLRDSPSGQKDPTVNIRRGDLTLTMSYELRPFGGADGPARKRTVIRTAPSGEGEPIPFTVRVQTHAHRLVSPALPATPRTGEAEFDDTFRIECKEGDEDDVLRVLSPAVRGSIMRLQARVEASVRDTHHLPEGGRFTTVALGIQDGHTWVDRFGVPDSVEDADAFIEAAVAVIEGM